MKVWAEDDRGERFWYEAFPHEEGGGFSYNIMMTSKERDVIHVDTKRGTIFDEEEIVAVRAYFLLVREKRRG